MLRAAHSFAKLEAPRQVKPSLFLIAKSRHVIRHQETQIRQQGGFANFWVQIAALVIAVAVVIALAAKYIW